MRAVVVALGKIGLPIAVQIARAGHDVVGCDIDARVVEQVNGAIEPFPGEAGLAEGLAEVVGNGRLRASTDTTAAVAEGADPVIARPAARRLRRRAAGFHGPRRGRRGIGVGLREGTTVSIEPTLPVGTTRTRLAPRSPRPPGCTPKRSSSRSTAPSGCTRGGSSPICARTPKLVGGLSDAGEARGIELYRSFLDAEVRGMGGAEAAELTKLAETTYRDVNIALANEFAAFADTIGVDIAGVIDAAELPAVLPHPPPGDRRGRALHPGLSTLLPLRRPRRPAAGRGP